MLLAVEHGVVLKGTRHGLMLCVREDVELESAVEQISGRLAESRGFLGEGAQVSLDLGWRELDSTGFQRILAVLAEQKVALVGVLSTSLQTRTVAEAAGHKAIIGRLGLAHHQGRQLRQRPPAPEAPAEGANVQPEEVVAQPDAEFETTAVPVGEQPPAAPEEREQEATLYIKRTLRSGQKAVYPGHIVLWGDLNPGAELEADGDVLVLGTVRGRIQAGCGGNAEAQIYCQVLHPTVLRIADGLWTGDASQVGHKLPGAFKVTCEKEQLRFEPALAR